MAAPVGHIICALALINSGKINISDKDAFLVGTSFPDIRYITNIERRITHKFDGNDLIYIFNTESSFEMGRRFHIFVDQEREKYMKDHKVYKFIKPTLPKTHTLKIIEDHILYPRLLAFDSHQVFYKIYDEELEYGLKKEEIRKWHDILETYLMNTKFNSFRYWRTFLLLPKEIMWKQKTYGLWSKTKNFFMLIYAYFQIENISRNQELRNLIFTFYDHHMVKILNDAVIKIDLRS